MKILVTGGTGFIGGNIVSKFRNLGHELIITGKTDKIGSEYLNKSFIDMDWSEIDGVDAVCHQSANNDTLDQDEVGMMNANFYKSKELFNIFYKKGCRKFIYASSCATYGNAKRVLKENSRCQPLNPYAKSKHRFDLWVKKWALNHPCDVVGLKYSNVYGPNESHKGSRKSMIYKMIHNRNNLVLFRDGNQSRDWIFGEDVAEANVKALDFKGVSIFNCGSGTTTSYNDIVKIIEKVYGQKINVTYIDNPYLGKFQNFTHCNMSKAKEALGFECKYSLEMGIQKYKEFLDEMGMVPD